MQRLRINFITPYFFSPRRPAVFCGALIVLLLFLCREILFAANSPDSVLVLRPRTMSTADTLLTFLPHRPLYRPRIGLALSGGGARAIAQIGVLQALEENGIPIDAVVGTSMGSIIGGLYCVGYSPQQLGEVVKTIEWEKLLIDKPPRRSLFIGKKQMQDRLLFQIRLDGLKPYIPPALTPGQRLQSILTELTMHSLYAYCTSFDRFRIPFRAVTTDLYAGEKVVLSSGDLAEAMRASLSFPLLFTPVPLGGKMLVDGGLLDNIPVDEVRKLGMDVVIAVDATSDLRKQGELHAPWEIADQVTTIMQRDRNRLAREMADVLIRIGDSERTSMDFHDVDRLIELGRQATLDHLPEIRQFLEMALPPASARDTLTITHLEAPEHLLANGLGQLLDGALLPVRIAQRDILRYLEGLYATGDYQDVFAEIRFSAAGTALRIQTVPNPTLRRVRFVGRSVFSEDSLQKWLSPLVGRPLNPLRTRRVLEKLLWRYRNLGYAMAGIRHLRFDSTTGVGTIFLEEGKIDTILISGNERTQNHVVLREFTLRPGDIFNYEKAKKGISNIFGTGLFYRVSLAVRREGGRLHLIIKLQEKKYHVLGLSFRSDSERRSRGYFELLEENFLGLGAQLALQSEFGSRDRLLQGYFSMERIFRSYLSLQMRTYWQWAQNFQYARGHRLPIGEYTESKFGLTVAVGQLVRKLGIVNVELHLDRFDLRPVTGGGYARGRFFINRITLRSILDTRDKLPYPLHGRYVHFFYDLANRRLKSDQSFNRIFLQVESYSTLFRRHTLRGRFMLGTADLTTPFPMFYRIGGSEQFFGLRDQEWSGRNFVILSFGYRYFVPAKSLLKLHFGFRTDIGGLWLNPEEANYRQVRKALGVFFGLETPLGAAEISYGKMDTGQRRFYFTLGYKF